MPTSIETQAQKDLSLDGFTHGFIALRRLGCDEPQAYTSSKYLDREGLTPVLAGAALTIEQAHKLISVHPGLVRAEMLAGMREHERVEIRTAIVSGRLSRDRTTTSLEAAAAQAELAAMSKTPAATDAEQFASATRKTELLAAIANADLPSWHPARGT